MVRMSMPYFMTNDEWYTYSNGKYHLTKKAPKKAKESYDEFYRAMNQQDKFDKEMDEYIKSTSK